MKEFFQKLNQTFTFDDIKFKKHLFLLTKLNRISLFFAPLFAILMLYAGNIQTLLTLCFATGLTSSVFLYTVSQDNIKKMIEKEKELKAQVLIDFKSWIIEHSQDEMIQKINLIFMIKDKIKLDDLTQLESSINQIKQKQLLDKTINFMLDTLDKAPTNLDVFLYENEKYLSQTNQELETMLKNQIKAKIKELNPQEVAKLLKEVQNESKALSLSL